MIVFNLLSADFVGSYADSSNMAKITIDFNVENEPKIVFLWDKNERFTFPLIDYLDDIDNGSKKLKAWEVNGEAKNIG